MKGSTLQTFFNKKNSQNLIKVVYSADWHPQNHISFYSNWEMRCVKEFEQVKRILTTKKAFNEDEKNEPECQTLVFRDLDPEWRENHPGEINMFDQVSPSNIKQYYQHQESKVCINIACNQYSKSINIACFKHAPSLQ